jgi:hypothetical protein
VILFWNKHSSLRLSERKQFESLKRLKLQKYSEHFVLHALVSWYCCIEIHPNHLCPSFQYLTLNNDSMWRAKLPEPDSNWKPFACLRYWGNTIDRILRNLNYLASTFWTCRKNVKKISQCQPSHWTLNLIRVASKWCQYVQWSIRKVGISMRLPQQKLILRSKFAQNIQTFLTQNEKKLSFFPVQMNQYMTR